MVKIEKIETFNKGVNFKRWVLIESDRELNLRSKINKISHVGNSEMGFCSILERGGGREGGGEWVVFECRLWWKWLR
jgi:hypothetical protein